MKFTSKNFKTLKTKNYLKNTNLLFLFNGTNRSSNDWIVIKQSLKTFDFSFYKIFNKTTTKTLESSVYNNAEQIINGPTFFFKPNNSSTILPRYALLNNFELLTFTILAVKLNNKIYSSNQMKMLNSFKYKENMLLFYQFELTHLKSSFIYLLK